MTEAQDRGIVRATVAIEGGFVNRPNDRGGPTNHGITGKSLIRNRRRKGGFVPNGADQILLVIKSLSKFEAESIYLEDYVRAPQFDKISEVRLRRLVVDSGVLHGRHRASRWLQQAVGTKADGIVGPKTLKALDSYRWQKVYCDILARRYLSVVLYTQRAPEQIEFLEGWINRANKLLKVLGSSRPSSE